MLTLNRMSQIQEIPSVAGHKDSSYNMLAILKSWEENKTCGEDNTSQFLLTMLLKVGLDCLILSLSQRRLHTSFMGICGLSVILVDAALSCAVAAVWVLGPASPQVSICFLLAHASAMFNALPLPVLGLGLLDYACFHTAPYRTLWYCTLMLVVWVLAGVHSYCSAFTGLIEVEYGRGRNALGCAVQDSALVVYFSVGISIAICCVLLFHYKCICSLMKEANRLSKQRDNAIFKLQHSLIYRYSNLKQLKADEEKALLGETKWQSPPLYLSLMLGFGTMWASYLVMCVACELLGLAVPAYISVNILWLKCADSLFVGLMFWLRSDWLGPYSDPPDELCQWQVYWHLSRGYVRDGENLPNAMSTLIGNDRNPLLQV